jgi:hypothetical protein
MAYNITSVSQCRKCMQPHTSAGEVRGAKVDIDTMVKTYQDVKYVSIPWGSIQQTTQKNYNTIGLLQGAKYNISETLITAAVEWGKAKQKAKQATAHILELFKEPGIGGVNGIKLYSLLGGVEPISYEFAAVVHALYELDRNGHTVHNFWELLDRIRALDIVSKIPGDLNETVDTIMGHVIDIRNMQTIQKGVTKYIAAQDDILTERHFKNLPGCSIITGGGGTGKTHTILEIVKYMASEGYTTMLLTPTNKAKAVLLSRLPEDCQHMVFTVDRYAYMEDFQVDVIVVDECSMLTNAHFSILRDAPAKRWTYLVGDFQQLPPVGTGSLFGDLIAGDYHNVVKLDKNYRTEAPDILRYADEVIRKRKIRINPSQNIEVTALPDYEAMVKDTNSHVITHTRAVVRHVNKIMMEIARNSGRAPKFKYMSNDSPEWYRNRMIFRKGKTYLDADTGAVVERDEDFSEHHMEPGFCTTIHTAQGGGWDTVYLILDIKNHEGWGNMERALFYTAVTRAKKKLVIITCNDHIGLKRYSRNTLLNGGLI